MDKGKEEEKNIVKYHNQPMDKKVFNDHLDYAIEHGLGIEVFKYTDGLPAVESVRNPSANVPFKKEYYNSEFDDNLRMKSNPHKFITRIELTNTITTKYYRLRLNIPVFNVDDITDYVSNYLGINEADGSLDMTTKETPAGIRNIFTDEEIESMNTEGFIKERVFF